MDDGATGLHFARTAGYAPPVIVMTLRRDPWISPQVLGTRYAVLLLHKPFSPQQLREVIGVQLHHRANR